MSKETWAEFAKRVKPINGQKFIDDLGQSWVHRNGDFVHEKNGIYLGEDGFGKILSCSLVDAIEHVDKPKLKKVTLYAYLYLNAHTWIKSNTCPHRRIYDASGTWMTRDIWVEDNA